MYKYFLGILIIFVITVFVGPRNLYEHTSTTTSTQSTTLTSQNSHSYCPPNNWVSSDNNKWCKAQPGWENTDSISSNYGVCRSHDNVNYCKQSDGFLIPGASQLLLHNKNISTMADPEMSLQFTSLNDEPLLVFNPRLKLEYSSQNIELIPCSIDNSNRFQCTITNDEPSNSGLITQEYNGYFGSSNRISITNWFSARKNKIVATYPFTNQRRAGQRYSMLSHGFIKPNKTGVYKFKLRSNDASHLFIGDRSMIFSDNSIYLTKNRRVINNGGVHGMRTVQSTKSLIKDKVYQIVIIYAQHRGGSGFEFTWCPPGKNTWYDTIENKIDDESLRFINSSGVSPPPTLKGKFSVKVQDLISQGLYSNGTLPLNISYKFILPKEYHDHKTTQTYNLIVDGMGAYKVVLKMKLDGKIYKIEKIEHNHNSSSIKQNVNIWSFDWHRKYDPTEFEKTLKFKSQQRVSWAAANNVSLVNTH